MDTSNSGQLRLETRKKDFANPEACTQNRTLCFYFSPAVGKSCSAGIQIRGNSLKGISLAFQVRQTLEALHLRDEKNPKIPRDSKYEGMGPLLLRVIQEVMVSRLSGFQALGSVR